MTFFHYSEYKAHYPATFRVLNDCHSDCRVPATPFLCLGNCLSALCLSRASTGESRKGVPPPQGLSQPLTHTQAPSMAHLWWGLESAPLTVAARECDFPGTHVAKVPTSHAPTPDKGMGAKASPSGQGSSHHVQLPDTTSPEAPTVGLKECSLISSPGSLRVSRSFPISSRTFFPY